MCIENHLKYWNNNPEYIENVFYVLNAVKLSQYLPTHAYICTLENGLGAQKILGYLRLFFC